MISSKVLLAKAEQEDNVRSLPVVTSCVKGCASCCRYPQTITLFEAIVRVESLELSQETVRQLKIRAAKDLRILPGLALITKRDCFFLDPSENLCSIYENRPIRCRTHAVTSDPLFCDPHCMGYGVVPVPNPSTQNVEQVLKDKAVSEGIRYPVLPLSTGYYVAYLIKTGKITLSEVSSTVRNLFQEGGKPK